jgi:mycofactocin precursor
MNLTEPDQTAATAGSAAETVDPAPPTDRDLVATDLIEEVSIDGMCGVY